MKATTRSYFLSKLLTLVLLTTVCSFLSASDSNKPVNVSSNDLTAKSHENKHITLFLQRHFIIADDPLSSFSFRIGLAKPNGEITWSKPLIMNDLPETPWKLCRVYQPEHGVYSIVVELLKVDSAGSITLVTQATNSENEHKYLNTFTVTAESQYVDQRFVLGKFVFN
jgi:hypothetical protein